MLARAILHHERSEFFTTATPFFTVRRQPNLSVKLSAACLGVALAKTGADSGVDEIAAARRNEIVPDRHNEIHAGA